MSSHRRSLSLDPENDDQAESPWPAFADIALALLLVFTLLVILQFLHYREFFILERLAARQDSVEVAIMESLTEGQKSEVRFDAPNEYHQRITLGAGMLFEECRSTLKPEGRDLITTIGASLRPYRLFFSAVQIEGHTDRQRPLPACGVADNWALSSERATAVVRILADSSVFRDQTLLSAVGRGEYHPVGEVLPSDTTAESLARHRRIEVFLQYSDRDLRGSGSQ